jgi:hypothetical protein
VISVLQMPLSLRHLLWRGASIAKALQENHPKRPRQLQRLKKLIAF